MLAYNYSVPALAGTKKCLHHISALPSAGDWIRVNRPFVILHTSNTVATLSCNYIHPLMARKSVYTAPVLCPEPATGYV